jgi:hypothetical protein
MDNNDLLRESLELQERLDDPFRMYGAMLGRNHVVMDIPRKGAAKMYRRNWDGCRDLWKESYRQSKEQRTIR